MNYRALIFDDQQDVRQMLWFLFDDRGYEVFTFPHPAICPFPLSSSCDCPCPTNATCTDLILSDLDMPFKNGFDFIEEQIKKGCHCRHLALMSGAFTEKHIAKAQELGIKIFKKPFTLAAMTEWIEQVEASVEPGRKLTDLGLKRDLNEEQI